ncbi:hypothetical protein T4E_10537 [Trichinella pseudospiralis]|uniref:Uncharacterized protein n=1 Tax=Trichinella pseudospiralis TaxID=6337 RepID=A0A0V0YB28_TRIPS|nr:hypothetical protein T4E_10537 [Trichinella pseudospiralis]
MTKSIHQAYKIGFHNVELMAMQWTMSDDKYGCDAIANGVALKSRSTLSSTWKNQQATNTATIEISMRLVR